MPVDYTKFESDVLGQQGSANLQAAQSVPPEAAAQALRHAPATGIPAPLGMYDPKPGMDMARDATSQTILKTQPRVASFVAGNQVHAAIVQNDLPALSKIGGWFDTFKGDLVNPIKGSWQQLQLNAARYYAVNSGQEPLNRKDWREYVPGFGAQDRALGNVLKSTFGLGATVLGGEVLNALYIQPGARVMDQLGQQRAVPSSPFGGPGPLLSREETHAANVKMFADSLLGLGPRGGRVAGAAAGAEMAAEAGGAGPRPGPNFDFDHPVVGDIVSTPQGNPLVFADQKAAARWILSEGYRNPANPQIFEVANGATAGQFVVRQSGVTSPVAEPVPPGVEPAADMAHGLAAEADAARVAALEQEVAGSKTLALSPETTKAFLEQQAPGKQAWIDVDALTELMAQGQGFEELNSIPGFVEQYQHAIVSGADIEVPFSDYVTAVSGKPSADALRQITRFSAEGASLHETQTFKANAAELGEAPPAEPPPAEDLSPEEHGRALEIVQAADEALAKVKKSQYLNGLFTDAKSVGMTQDQFTRYSKRLETQLANVRARLVKRAYDQIRRERRPDWLEKMAQNRYDAQQTLFGRRDIITQHALAYNQFPNGAPLETPRLKLSRKATEKQYPQLAASLPAKYFTAEGVSADDLADIFGYETGEALMKDLAGLEVAQTALGVSPKEYVTRLSEGIAHNATETELGHDLTPENIREAASEAVNDKVVTEFLSDELHTLGAQVGLSLDKTQVEAEAMALFEKLQVKNAINVKEIERAAFKAAKRAEMALLKDDFGAAFVAKQQQLISQIHLREAHKLAKDFVKTLKKFNRWARKPSMKGVAQEWLNYVHAELTLMGFPVKRNPAELAEQLGGVKLSDFIANKEAQGAVIVYGDFAQVPPAQMRVEHYRAARDTLSSLMHNGRVAEGVVIDGKRQALEDIVSEVKANGDKLGRKLTPGRLERLGALRAIEDVSRGLNAPMIRPEQLLDEVDVNDPLGPLNRSVIAPLQAGKAVENDLSAWAAKSFKEFGKTAPKEWLGSMEERVDVPELPWTDPETGAVEPLFVTRGQLVKAALYWGNPSNKLKLLEGYGWDEATVKRVFDARLTKTDWDFAQKVWDLHEEMWPKIAATYRNLSGIAPVKIEPVAFDTPHGKYKGGYFTISYDKLRSPVETTMSKDSIWGEDYSSALPANPYTKGRTAFVAPVALNWSGLNRTLSQIIHDVAFREPLLQAQRVLSNRSVIRAVQDNFGPEYSAQLTPWMEYVARERVFDDKAAGALENYLRGFRGNMTFVGLAYRASSAMIHFSVAMSDSIAEVGAVPFAKACADIYRTPKQLEYWSKFISERSPEVRHRMVNMDQNVREAVADLVEKRGALSNVRKFGYHMLALSDNVSAMPTWLAAYEQEIKAGKSEGDAILVADKRVRQAHGASAGVDLPAIQRAGQGALGEAGRSTFGLFLSFQNHSYNRMWQQTRRYRGALQSMGDGDWAGGSRDFARAMAQTFFYIMAPTLIVKKLHDLQAGHNDDSFTGWLSALGHASFGGYPGANTLVDAVAKKPTSSPIEQAVTAQIATVENAWHAAHGDDRLVSKRWLQQAITTAGIWGAPISGQMGATGQYLWDFSTGAPGGRTKNVGDFLHGVVYGPKKTQGKH